MRKTKKTVSEILKSLRKKTGKSINEFSSLAGVTPQSLWGWESGHRIPTFSSLKKICDAVDCSLSIFDNVSLPEE